MSDRSIFLAALEIADTVARSAYLDQACADEPNLRSQVEQLLAAHAEPGDFLLRPAPALLATLDEPIAERPGTIIGPYKLLEQIGEGGFGVVFMAEQQRPVRRKVALKVLKPGMDTRQVVARFEAERQALALMDHPNIAHVFDGGTTETGRPYFVMDLVRGVPITEYCDQAQLTTRERLDLFAHVCQAIQHAHQKGIIHRDIKPTNVMVTLHDGEPLVKVIDFGVAKALGQQLTDKTLFTGFAQLVGTPLYMSPEQAAMSNVDVDTRSDIYSLGVLLYELLTGTTPFEKERMSKIGYDEMRRIIREEEPPKPSTRISTLGQAASTVSTQRKSDPKRLSQLIRGELDWIVMKCLEKDRNRRYETANGLAMDVQRYLRDEPVLACPPSAWYRFRKFARRKKIALAMAACVLLALSGVAGGVGWAVRDKRARDDASQLDRLAREKALDQVVERSLDETDPLMDEGRWLEALAIIERTEQLLDAAGRTERPARLMELRKALAAVQRLEGIYQGPMRGVRSRRRIVSSPEATLFETQTPEDVYDEAFFWGRRQDADFTKAFMELGIDVETQSPAEAAEKIRRQSIRAALVRALDGWATFRKRSQGELRWRGEANSDWKKLIEIARQADADDWRNRCRDALRNEDRPALEELADAAPVRQSPPESLYLLGQALKEVGAVDKAMTFLERARREYPGDLWLNDALAHLSWSACQPPRWDAALRYYAAVLALRPDFSPVHLSVGDAFKAKGANDEALLEYSKAIELEPKSIVVWTIRGNYYRSLGRYDEAVADYSKAIELEPTNVPTWQSRSAVFLEAGEYDSALVDATQIVKTLRERVELGAAEPNVRVELGHSLWHLARVLSSTSKDAEVERTLHEALEVFEGLASEYPQERYYRLETAYTLRQLFFDVWRRAERTGEAVEGMRRAIDLYAALVAEEPHFSYRSEFAFTCNLLAQYLQTQRRISEAEGNFRQAIDARRTLAAEQPTSERRLDLAITHANLASLYRDAHRLAEAEEGFRAAIEIDRQILSESPFPGGVPWNFCIACRELASILRNTDRPTEANELCRRIAQECRSALVQQKQVVRDRNLPEDRWHLAATLESLARLLDELGETGEAESCCREANSIWQKLVAALNLDDHRFHLGANYDILGGFLRRLGRTEEAIESYRAARDVWQKLVTEFNDEDRRKHLAWTNEGLGELHDAAGRLDDAAADHREAAEVWEKLATDFPQTAAYRDYHCNRLNVLANLYVKYGRLPEADQILTKAVEKSPNQAAAWRSRGDLFARWGLLREAADDLAQAYVLQETGDSVQSFVHALLRAYVGDAAGYRDACAQMLARFADSTKPNDWNNVAGAVGISAESGVEPSRAVAFAERAVRENRIVWRVAYLGMAHYRAGEFERAAATLEESLTIDASYNPAWVYSALAMARHQLGNPQEAAAALVKAGNARDERVAALLAGGLGHWPNGPWWDTVYAECLYKEAHTLVQGSPPPEDPRWFVLRGRGLEAIGRAEEARAALADAFSLAPDDLMIRIQALPDVSRADAFAPALADLRAFLKEHPQQPLAARLALAQRELQWGGPQARAGQFQAAAETFAAAAAGFENVIAQLVANSDSTTVGVPATAKDIAWYRHELGYVLVFRGAVLLNLSQLTEAEAALRHGLEIHESLLADVEAPSDSKSRLAWNHASLARLHGVLAVRLAKEGAADQAKGQFREAIAGYTKAIELAPDNAVTHNNSAWFYATCPDAELRDPSKAVALAKKAVELRPKVPSGWNTLGVAHYRAGDWSAAIEALTKSMELRDGGDAFDWYFLAMAHWRLGQHDDARKWHQQAVEWVRTNEQKLSGNPQWADELRRFGAEAEETLGNANESEASE